MPRNQQQNITTTTLIDIIIKTNGASDPMEAKTNGASDPMEANAVGDHKPVACQNVR